MRALPAIVLGIALLAALAATLGTSQSQTNVTAVLMKGDDLAARRTRLVEFGAQHDWRAELAAHGVDLPASTVDQIVAPLVGRDAAEGEGGLVQVMISLEIRGMRAFYPQFDRIDVAVHLIEARLRLEALFIDIESAEDAEVRRSKIWKAFGTGFVEEVLAFLSAWEAREPDAELRAFIGGLTPRLRPEVAAPAGEQR